MHRFRIQSLLACTLCVAIFLGVGRGIGYVAAACVAAAVAMLYWAFRSRRRGLMWVPRVAAALIGLPMLWIAAIDAVWVLDECEHCHMSTGTLAYRVAGVTVWREVDKRIGPLTLALRDLGVPCQHTSDPWIKHRYWGLVFCACPCNNSTYFFMPTDERYTPGVSRRVQAIGEADPEPARQLRLRVVMNEDWNYFWTGFMHDLYARDAIASGEAVEASTWLANSDLGEERTAGLSWTNQLSVETVRTLYNDGALKVYVAWPDGFRETVIVRLPAGGPVRGNLVRKISEHIVDNGDPNGLIDYGQEFVFYR